MHYANGRAAKAGDVIRGKGYNIKHEITGLLLFANPTSNACNCTIAAVTKSSQVLHHAFPQAEPDVNGSVFYAGLTPGSQFGVLATIEHGQLDAFVAIDPDTGEVLPPEA